MAIPHVRYATTSDGKSIAYSVAGSGPAVIWLPTIFNHVQVMEGRWPWLAQLRQSYRVALYDGRGQGMSTRGLPPDFEMREWETDLGAVQEALGSERAALVAAGCHGVHIAVRYAVAHPERVAALVLVSCCVRLDEWGPGSLWEQLPYENWDLFLSTSVPRNLPPGRSVDAVAEMRSMVTQEEYRVFDRVTIESTVATDLPQLEVPTLVLHPRNFTMLKPEQGAEFASLVPDARMLQIGGHEDSVWGDPSELIEAIDGFLSEILGRPATGGAALEGTMPEHLTRREIEVLRLIASGRSNREIADELVLSVRTVERHITNLYGKISARGKADATAFALRSGVL
jgi:pimeloyl-ACP methyl ester carboxylesterase/DNA-binding CsgD family transcriptional regulator